MKRAFLILALVTTGIFSGCDKTATSGPATAPATAAEDPFNRLPTRAIPKLQTIKLYLGAESLDAEMALTAEQERTGMMFRTNIQETDAMIFPLPYPQQANFWMKNCPESLSAAYITPDGVIQEIHHLEKNDTNAVLSARNDILYVLETKDGWFTRHHVGVGTAIVAQRGALSEVFRRR